MEDGVFLLLGVMDGCLMEWFYMKLVGDKLGWFFGREMQSARKSMLPELSFFKILFGW